jgi:hypothetical protein
MVNLSAQRGFTFEIILCDGGSTDGSLQLSREHAEHVPYPVELIKTPPGRGTQMNAGVNKSASDLLLFLHADSRLFGNNGLCEAVSAFRRSLDTSECILAARFGLRFSRQNSLPSLAYTFYEAKARLNRADCIRGDQGLMISRAAFDHLGRFDTSLPFLEDVRLAGKVANNGHWLLLPAELMTSTRRFEQEGFYERQVINAIIANAVAIGWNEFFTALPDLYRTPCDSGRIDLFPFLEGIRKLLTDKPDPWRRTFWQDTGRHVAENAWQLCFWLDVHRAFNAGRGPGEVRPRCLQFYCNRLEPLFKTAFAGWLARKAVQIWFRLMLFRGTSRRT